MPRRTLKTLLCCITLCLGFLALPQPAQAQAQGTPGNGSNSNSAALPDAAQQNQPIVAMSFNIRYGTANDGDNHWDKRHHTVDEMIRKHDPDLVGLQECLAFQLEYLKKQLPGYDAYALGRDKDGAGEMCAILYKRDRFALQAEHTRWLSPTPEVPVSRGWDAALPRIVSWVQLTDLYNNQPVSFANAHFDHRGKEARPNSAALIGQWITDGTIKSPVILVGDFNADPASQTHQNFVNQGDETNPGPGLIDTMLAAHPDADDDVTNGTFHGFIGEAAAGRTVGDGPNGLSKQIANRIDWILATPDYQTMDAAILKEAIDGRHPSDHFPVIATLLPSPGPGPRK